MNDHAESKKTCWRHWIILLGAGFLFLMAGNGLFHLTNPDEVFYVQTAREMMQKQTWLTPSLFDQPQFEKPIFLYWCLRVAFLPGGVTPAAARFFPAVFGILGICAIYLLGTIGFKNSRKAFWASLISMSSVLYVGLSRTVFTDMMFSVQILLALLSFYWGYEQKNKRSTALLLFFVFSALAVLTKGPLGFILPVSIVVVFLLLQGEFRAYLRRPALGGGLLLFGLLAIPWYAWMMAHHGSAFTQEFFVNDHVRRLLDAEHPGNDNWYFYPLSMIGCVFPWSLFLVAAFIFWGVSMRRNRTPMRLFLGIWILVAWGVFQLGHSKLVSYIFPLFPALALLIADFLIEALESEKYRRFLILATGGTLLLLILIPLGYFPFRNKSIVRAIITPAVWVSLKIAYGCLLIIALGSLISLIRRKNPAVALLFVVPVILGLASAQSDMLDPWVSSARACKSWMAQYPIQGTILCSKGNARAIYAFTDHPVAVVAIHGSPYFSPHPIPFFTAPDPLLRLLQRQHVTYGIVFKNSVKQLERLDPTQFKYECLETIGNQYLVKIQFLFGGDLKSQDFYGKKEACSENCSNP